MVWVYQNEQKCMFIFWSLRAVPWSVTNAEIHSSFPLWDSLGRESFVWCCVSAGKLLFGWQVTPQGVISSSAISQPSMASYYQRAWFSQLGLTPAHRLPHQSPAALCQSLSKERWSAAPVLQPRAEALSPLLPKTTPLQMRHRGDGKPVNNTKRKLRRGERGVPPTSEFAQFALYRILLFKKRFDLTLWATKTLQVESNMLILC